MKQVIFEPTVVWQYHEANKKVLENNVLLIAKNEEYGVEIFLSSDGTHPQFNVIADDTLQYSDFAMNEEDCINTLNEIFDDYLTENIVQNLINKEIDESCEHPTDTDDDDGSEIIELIKAREAVLVSTLLDFVIESMDSDTKISEPDFWDKLQDCLEHFLKYLSEKGFDVYRPMLIKDEATKKVSLVEYPYKEYDF